PVALGVEVTEEDLLVEAVLDACRRARDLARDERNAAARALVVEQDAARDEQAVRIAVVLAELVREHLGARVRAARRERRRLVLRRRRAAEHLARRRLI